MNEIDVKAEPVYGGYRGLFRKVHKAAYEAVCVNGVAQIYDSADAAEVAAWRALKAHLQADIVGTGEKAGAALSEAEAKFSKLFKGGGKTIVVERR